jgi:hypothetical protein
LAAGGVAAADWVAVGCGAGVALAGVAFGCAFAGVAFAGVAFAGAGAGDGLVCAWVALPTVMPRSCQSAPIFTVSISASAPNRIGRRRIRDFIMAMTLFA